MKEILENISTHLEKDFIDYIGIFAPIVLSVIAILISMWNSFWVNKLKKVEGNLVWDELFSSFFILIRNTGKATLVIKQVSLVAYASDKTTYDLGTRDNAWAFEHNKGYLPEKETMVITPFYGSIYDVFSYKGHAFDVDDSISNLPVKLIIKDIDSKEWKFETPFSLGEIDEKLGYAVRVERFETGDKSRLCDTR